MDGAEACGRAVKRNWMQNAAWVSAMKLLVLASL